MPWSTFSRHHYCATAYFVAGVAAREVTNVYDNALYDRPDSVASAQRKPRTIDGFNVDVYEYPPPFLLLPRVLMRVAPEFTRFRMVWFGLSSASLLVAMLLVAAALPRAQATRAVLLMPLVWASLSTIGGLQMGNFQVMTLAISMAAMALFSRRQHAAGGALLGFAVAGKLFPGMLLRLPRCASRVATGDRDLRRRHTHRSPRGLGHGPGALRRVHPPSSAAARGRSLRRVQEPRGGGCQPLDSGARVQAPVLWSSGGRVRGREAGGMDLHGDRSGRDSPPRPTRPRWRRLPGSRCSSSQRSGARFFPWATPASRRCGC